MNDAKNTDSLVPKLRFKGFTDDWTQRKLGEVTKRIKSYSLPHSMEVSYNTSTKVIHYGDIHTGKVKEINNIDVLPNIEDKKYVSLEKGDIVVADASEDYKGIADAAILKVNSENIKVVSGLHTIAFRLKDELYPEFLYLYFNTDVFEHFGYKAGSGLKVYGISYTELCKFKLKYPTIEEQKKISKTIEVLNKTISIQQRKLALLKQLKKGLLQEMFSDKKNKNPKIRFSKFTSNWKEYKLGTIFSERLDKNKESKDYQLLSVSVQKGIYPFDEKKRKNNFSKDKRNYKIVHKNDIAYNSMRMWQGAEGVVNKEGIVSPAYTVLIPKKNQNSYFYFYMFKRSKVEFLFRRNSQGLTSDTWNLKYPFFKRVKIYTTNSDEQKKIVKFLTQLDSLIVTNQKKLDKFRQIKKFLLQNMFI